MRSRILLRRSRDRAPVDSLQGASVLALSDAVPEWQGIHVEVMRHAGWYVDDLMFDGHFIGLNLSATTLHFEARCGAQWSPVSIPSEAFWIIPEGQPFSIRNGPQCYTTNAVIDGGFLDSVLGGHYELAPRCGFSDAVIAHAFRGLTELVVEGASHDARMTASMIRSFVTALATRHGKPVAPEHSTALTPAQLETTCAWIELRLEQAITIEQIAARIGLSAPHFSRAFKRATGTTPWEYVITLRLDRAASMLKTGASASCVAHDCGFSDQAHLSRLFKRRYGISPSAFSGLHKERAKQLMSA